jgi:hypothetical protein
VEQEKELRTLEPDEQLRILVGRAEITDTMHTYATAVDTCDWALLRSIFTDQFTNGTFTSDTGDRIAVDGDYWMKQLPALLEGFDATQHFLSNHRVTIDEDHARCVSYVCARHFYADAPGVNHYTVGGYYDCDFTRTQVAWKMSIRRMFVTWTEGDPGLLGKARERSANEDRARVRRTSGVR